LPSRSGRAEAEGKQYGAGTSKVRGEASPSKACPKHYSSHAFFDRYLLSQQRSCERHPAFSFHIFSANLIGFADGNRQRLPCFSRATLTPWVFFMYPLLHERGVSAASPSFSAASPMLSMESETWTSDKRHPSCSSILVGKLPTNRRLAINTTVAHNFFHQRISLGDALAIILVRELCIVPLLSSNFNANKSILLESEQLLF